MLGTQSDTSSNEQTQQADCRQARNCKLQADGRHGKRSRKLKLGHILGQNNPRGSAMVSFLNVTQTYFGTSEDALNHLTNRNDFVKVTVFGVSDNRTLNWILKSRIDCAEGVE